MMICPGYKRSKHEAKEYCKGLCEKCYQHKYRDEHQEKIAKLQQEYRADAGYRRVQCLYMREYRKRR